MGAVTVSAVDGNIYVDPTAVEQPHHREKDWEGLTDPIGTKNIIVYTSSVHKPFDEQRPPRTWPIQ